MRSKGLALKFFLPVSLSLAVLLGLVIWGVSTYQTSQTEKAFERGSQSHFEGNPALDVRVGHITDANGEPRINVLSPGRVAEVLKGTVQRFRLR